MYLFYGRALVSKALIENPNLINWWLTFKAFYGLVALICGNGYIVGINQIYDIGIDKYVIFTCNMFLLSTQFTSVRITCLILLLILEPGDYLTILIIISS